MQAPAAGTWSVSLCLLAQCKAYLAQPAELVTGLNLIHTTNLDYFTTQHQAEIFRLKGHFLQVYHPPHHL